MYISREWKLGMVPDGAKHCKMIGSPKQTTTVQFHTRQIFCSIFGSCHLSHVSSTSAIRPQWALYLRDHVHRAACCAHGTNGASRAPSHFWGDLVDGFNQIDGFHSDNAVDVFDDQKKKKTKKKKTVLMLFCVFVSVFLLLILLLSLCCRLSQNPWVFHGFPIPTSLGHLGPAGDRRCVGMPRLNPSAKFDVESEYSKHIWGVAVKCLGSRA